MQLNFGVCQNMQSIYLNDVSSGGLTSFPKLNYAVKPVCGRATYFKYDYKDEDTNMKTLHVGEPPTDGAIKWIATVWIFCRTRND